MTDDSSAVSRQTSVLASDRNEARKQQRLARAAEARRLRAEGLNGLEIAERMGVSRSYASDLLTDPEGLKNRERKERYRRPCSDCGELLSGCNGHGPNAAQRCVPCNAKRVAEGHGRWLVDSLNAWVDIFGVPPVVADWSAPAARNCGQEWRIARTQSTGRAWPSVASAADHYGSWNAFLRANGWEGFQLGEYGRDGEDPAVVAETARLYREGKSTIELAGMLGIHPASVRARLVQAGEPRRTAAEAQALRRRKAATESERRAA